MTTHINRLVFLSILVLQYFLPALSSCPNNITSIFAFGDGFFDTGNNNEDLSICYAKHKPYGSNFPDHFPTGRFSDAEIASDLLSFYLGHSPLLPAFSNPAVTTEDLLSGGVSFASGCSGMDDYTSVTTRVLSLPVQYESFRIAMSKMMHKVGQVETAKVVHGALYLISGGTHDFLNNFYPLPFRSDYSASTYIGMLHANLVSHIKKLYNVGGRKFAVVGLPPMGCLPLAISAQATFERKCVDSYNRHSQAYNKKLLDLLLTINKVGFPGIRAVYVDIYTPMMDMIRNPAKYEMEVVSRGCCGTGFVAIGTTCSAEGFTCNTPHKFVFWDSIHPSQAAYRAINKYIEHSKALDSIMF